jgi:hypothetical protein
MAAQVSAHTARLQRAEGAGELIDEIIKVALKECRFVPFPSRRNLYKLELTSSSRLSSDLFTSRSPPISTTSRSQRIDSTTFPPLPLPLLLPLPPPTLCSRDLPRPSSKPLFPSTKRLSTPSFLSTLAPDDSGRSSTRLFLAFESLADASFRLLYSQNGGMGSQARRGHRNVFLRDPHGKGSFAFNLSFLARRPTNFPPSHVPFRLPPTRLTPSTEDATVSPPPQILPQSTS